jgi:hypothetical protein
MEEEIQEIEVLSSQIKTKLKIIPQAKPPRLLTNKEIEYIVNDIPIIISADPKHGELIRKNLIRNEKTKLRMIEVTPDGIEDFKDAYISKIHLSQIDPGSAIGLTAAEAIAQPLSQQTFNSFHLAGTSKNIMSGIVGFMEIFEIRSRKKPYMALFFKKDKDGNRPTLNEIITMRAEKITTTSVKDCVYQSFIEAEVNLFPNKQRPSWYLLFNMTVNKNMPNLDSPWILRLILDLDRMYRFKVRPSQIAAVLIKEDIVKCAYSPLIKYDDRNAVIMDIFVTNVQKLKDKASDKSVLNDSDRIYAYLQNILTNKLDLFKIKGLNNIADIEPIIKNIPFSLYAEFAAATYFNNYTDFNFIKLNWVYMLNNNIDMDDIIRLLRTCGCEKVIEVAKQETLSKFDDLDLLVKIPKVPEGYTESPKSILKIISFLVKKDKDGIAEYRNTKKKEKNELLQQALKITDEDEKKRLIIAANNIKIYRNPSTIYNDSNLIYAETSGSDFGNVFRLNDIDYTKSYTNNFNDLLNYFGIEVVRTFVITNLLDLIRAADSYIDPRHAVLIGDWMTMFGVITPFSVKGMRKHKMGAMAESIYRGPLDAMKKESIFNRIDTLDNVISSIGLGRKPVIGTGMVTILPDLNKIKQKINNTKKGKTKLSSGTMSEIIKNLENINIDERSDNSNLLSIPALELSPVDIPIVQSTGLIELTEQFPLKLWTPAELFPVRSDELKSALSTSEQCESPEVQVTNRKIIEKIDKNIESFTISPVGIPENIKMNTQVQEKPPEISAPSGGTMSLDDFL